jgi:hypothetical protein
MTLMVGVPRSVIHRPRTESRPQPPAFRKQPHYRVGRRFRGQILPTGLETVDFGVSGGGHFNRRQSVGFTVHSRILLK